MAAWRRRHPDHDREDRLRRRLQGEAPAPIGPDPRVGLDWQAARNAVGMEVAVVVEETGRLLATWARNAVTLQLPGMVQQSDRLATAAGEVPSSGLYARLLRGSNAELRGDLEAAERIYRGILADEADQVIALNNLAFVLLKARRLGEALTLAQHSLAEAPDQPDVLDTCAQVLRDLGRPEEAERLVRRSLAVRPKHCGARLTLVGILLDQSRLDQAREILLLAEQELMGQRWARRNERDLAADLRRQLTQVGYVTGTAEP